jgi:hypothetical protein
MAPKNDEKSNKPEMIEERGDDDDEIDRRGEVIFINEAAMTACTLNSPPNGLLKPTSLVAPKLLIYIIKKI